MKTKIDILIKGNLIVNNELLTMGGGTTSLPARRTFNNTGAVSGLIDKLELTFTGSNMTTVQQRNILRNSVSVPVGSSTVNSFNNPDMYTTSTSSIYGGMTLAAYNGTKQICINTTSFSGSVAASGSF